MSTDLPYLITNKRLADLFSKIQTAAVPTRFTFEFLKKLGFNSSNDRALPSLLKKLGFLDQSGVPTARYNAYRNHAEAKTTMAEALRECYSEVFALDENAYKAAKEHLSGMINRITGEDQKYVTLMSSTFQALCALADFETVPSDKTDNDDEKSIGAEVAAPVPPKESKGATISFRHNIEVHLPATTNIAVYNAIFKSIKDHLLD